MPADPVIPRKWRLSAHGRRSVFLWGEQERSVHTLMKAFLWALYLPDYPHISVEVRVGDRYKPDVVAYAGEDIAPEGILQVREPPLFWGECGQVGREKLHTLVRRYRATHFALAKWDSSLRAHAALVEDALDGVTRSAPFDILIFPPDCAARFINADGSIYLTHTDLEWLRLG